MQVTLDAVLHCPRDTHPAMTYSLIPHRKTAEEVWWAQTAGKASPKTQRAGDAAEAPRRR